jgi:DNA-binding MarR family transcriptional regulator
MLDPYQAACYAAEMAEPVPAADDGAAPRLTYLIKRVEMAERARMEESLRPYGISLHQYTALSLLERRGGLSSAQLARRHFVTPQAMNQLVATLEDDGLIERQPDPVNRRILRASLTKRGQKVLRACHTAVDDLEKRMLAALTPTQGRELRRSLERTLTTLTQMGD